MKQWFKNNGTFAVVVYLIVSGIIVVSRATRFGEPIDCEIRYVDIVFPLSRLHCPVGWLK